MKPIYLDYNATTPIDGRVVEAMLPYITDHFGNPSSSHALGRRTRAAVDKARSQAAALLRADPADIIFTSGGTEANNHAIIGAALANRDRGRHIVTTRVEHPAVSEVCLRHAEHCHLQSRRSGSGYGLLLESRRDQRRRLGRRFVELHYTGVPRRRGF